MVTIRKHKQPIDEAREISRGKKVLAGREFSWTDSNGEKHTVEYDKNAIGDNWHSVQKHLKGHQGADYKTSYLDAISRHGNPVDVNNETHGKSVITFSDGTKQVFDINEPKPVYNYQYTDNSQFTNNGQIIQAGGSVNAQNTTITGDGNSVAQSIGGNANAAHASVRKGGSGGGGNGGGGNGGGETPETPEETPEETPTTPAEQSELIKFFTSPAVLITVGVVSAIVATYAVLSRSIKGRFRKTAKVLYNLQKDFGSSKNGLDMDHAMKGIGSKITDGLLKLFGIGNGEKGKGAIGILPFVQGYRDELKNDFAAAEKTFNSIAEAGSAEEFNTDDGTIHGNKSQKESQEIVYKSFYEAFTAGKLNESVDVKNMSQQQINESILATVGLALAAGRLAYKAGQYIYMKFKDGKPAGATAVEVTKQSTREVCFSIMNMFFSKYFNMEGLSKKLGLNVSSLADIDASNVDKFQKVVEQLKTEQSDNVRVSKMFNRVRARYDKMVERYLTIAKNLVTNFEKYSKKMKTKDGKKELSEKDSNLLVSGSQKLYAELDRQEDIYKNNFFRVANAIIASPEYVGYIDFIVSRVIPVFKTGLASDADYVLDTMPRVGEIYVISQTNSQQTGVGFTQEDDNQAGNIGLVRIESVDKDGNNSKNPIIKFSKLALLKGMSIDLDYEGNFDLSYATEDNVDHNAFRTNGDDKNPDTAELPYNKWIALNPYLGVNLDEDILKNISPKDEAPSTNNVVGMKRNGDNGEEYLFIFPEETDDSTPTQQNSAESTPEYTKNDTEGFAPDTRINEADDENNSVEDANVKQLRFVKKDEQGTSHMTVIDIPADINVKQFVEFAKQSSNDPKTNMGFVAMPSEETAKQFQEVKNINNSTGAKAEQQDQVPEIINGSSQQGNVIDVLNNSSQQCTEYFNQQFQFFLAKDKQPIKYFSGERLKQTKGNLILSKNVNGVVPIALSDKTSINAWVYNVGKTNLAIGCTLVVMNNDAVNKYFVSLQQNQQTPLDDNVFNQYVNSLYSRLFLLKKDDSGNYVQIEGIASNGFNNLSNAQQQLQEKLKEVITKYQKSQTYIDQVNAQQTTHESVSYTLSSQLNESITSVSITRNIPNAKYNGSYILSENCWGDGMVLNPERYLTRLNNQILEANTYSDIASYAKRNKNISIVPFNENTQFTVDLPQNRYGVLTKGCPLYESLTIVSFDKGNVNNIQRLGVYKFIK